MCGERRTLTGRADLSPSDNTGLVVGVAPEEATVDKVLFVAATNVIGAPDDAAPDCAPSVAVVAGAEASVVVPASLQ